MRLSPHFNLREMTRSQTAARMGIANIPSDDEVHNLRVLCRNILEPIRARYRVAFSPSSGYRSPALNEAIGGSRRSQHTKGEAVDFEIPHVSNFQVAKWIENNLLFDQLILEHYIDTDPGSGWIHVSRSAGVNRREVLRFDGTTYRSGLGYEGSNGSEPTAGNDSPHVAVEGNKEMRFTEDLFGFINWIREIFPPWSK